MLILLVVELFFDIFWQKDMQIYLCSIFSLKEKDKLLISIFLYLKYFILKK